MDVIAAYPLLTKSHWLHLQVEFTKNRKPVARDKKEARELEFKERLKVQNNTYFEDQQREELKDFATFVDKVYLPFAREHHAPPEHDEFRCVVLKNSLRARSLATLR
jgi:hypothetical protein